MLKRPLQKARWIIVGVVIFGAIVFVASKQHTAAEKYERERQARCVSASLDPKEQDTCKHKGDSRYDYLPWWYVLVAWPEGITTWAIIVTGLAIFWQAWETRKAAKAALLSVQSVIAAQRAWITYVQVIIDPVSNSVDMATSEEFSGRYFRFQWKNSGLTPALKCSLNGDGRIIASGDMIQSPAFTPSQSQDGRAPIIPGITASGPRFMLKDETLDLLKKRQSRFFLYGRADYHIVYPSVAPTYTEVCVEITYFGRNSKTGEEMFNFLAAGPQNDAT